MRLTHRRFGSCLNGRRLMRCRDFSNRRTIDSAVTAPSMRLIAREAHGAGDGFRGRRVQRCLASEQKSGRFGGEARRLGIMESAESLEYYRAVLRDLAA